MILTPIKIVQEHLRIFYSPQFINQKMNKLFVSLIPLLFFVGFEPCYSQNPEELKLKDFRPKSIYKVPVNIVKKAKFPAIDMHSHVFAKTGEDIATWVKTMDAAGIEKTIILTGATGAKFDSIYSLYSKYPGR